MSEKIEELKSDNYFLHIMIILIDLYNQKLYTKNLKYNRKN